MPSIKKIVYLILVSLVIICSSSHVQAQIPDEIILSLGSGNAKVLSKYFNTNIDLVVLENDNVYSKAQAQQIVGNFFATYTPISFEVIHNSGKEGANYVIGNLKTKSITFRVNFLLKKENGKEYIHQLRIEKQ